MYYLSNNDEVIEVCWVDIEKRAELFEVGKQDSRTMPSRVITGNKDICDFMIEDGVLVCLTVWGTLTWTPLPEIATSVTCLSEYVTS